MPDFGSIPGIGPGGIDPDELSPIAHDPSIMGAIRGAEARGSGDTPIVPDQRREYLTGWFDKLQSFVRNAEESLKIATAQLADTSYTGPIEVGGIEMSKGLDGSIDSAAIVGFTIGSQTVTTGVSGAVDAGNKIPQLQRMVSQKQ